MDYGVIGNCQYIALIDSKCSVNWLCWPRFDSSFVFGELLDKTKGGRFQINFPNPVEGEQFYVPNTNVLHTYFDDGKNAFEVIDFAPRFFQNDRSFRPTHLVRIVRPLKGEPRISVKCKPAANYGRAEIVPVVGSNHIRYLGTEKPLRLTTTAPLSFIETEQAFALEKTEYFYLSYGTPLEAEIGSTCELFLTKTTNYWRQWVKHCFLPSEYQHEVIRSALVLKLHQFEDTGAIIASATTSIPEAKGTVRTWDYRYCWLRDAVFSLVALQRLTHFEEMDGFITYLRNLLYNAKESVEKLQPVYRIDCTPHMTEELHEDLEGYLGHKPVRIGNQAHEHVQHDIYGEMIIGIGRFFLDARFDPEMENYPTELIEALLDRIEHYMREPDAGLWEFRGKQQIHTFTILMHWAGAVKTEEIARKLGRKELEEKAKKLKKEARSIIENECWSEKRQAYAQAVGSEHLDACNLMLVNLGFLKPNDPRAKSHVQATADDLMTESGLIRRYRHTDDFGDTENVFTLCNFWLVEAWAIIGETEKARSLLELLLRASNRLGLYSEDLDPRDMTQWGNFPQTYSHVGLINAVFQLSKPWKFV